MVSECVAETYPSILLAEQRTVDDQEVVAVGHDALEGAPAIVHAEVADLDGALLAGAQGDAQDDPAVRAVRVGAGQPNLGVGGTLSEVVLGVPAQDGHGLLARGYGGQVNANAACSHLWVPLVATD